MVQKSDLFCSRKAASMASFFFWGTFRPTSSFPGNTPEECVRFNIPNWLWCQHIYDTLLLNLILGENNFGFGVHRHEKEGGTQCTNQCYVQLLCVLFGMSESTSAKSVILIVWKKVFHTLPTILKWGFPFWWLNITKHATCIPTFPVPNRYPVSNRYPGIRYPVSRRRVNQPRSPSPAQTAHNRRNWSRHLSRLHELTRKFRKFWFRNFTQVWPVYMSLSVTNGSFQPIRRR